MGLRLHLLLPPSQAQPAPCTATWGERLGLTGGGTCLGVQQTVPEMGERQWGARGSTLPARSSVWLAPPGAGLPAQRTGGGPAPELALQDKGGAGLASTQT